MALHLQVMQLTWTGQVQHMASVGSSPPPLLAGALTDSLLLVRQNPVTGAHEVRCCGQVVASYSLRSLTTTRSAAAWPPSTAPTVYVCTLLRGTY